MLTVNVNRKLQPMLRYLQACPVTGMQVESPLQFQGQGYEMFLIPATGIGWRRVDGNNGDLSTGNPLLPSPGQGAVQPRDGVSGANWYLYNL